MTRAVHRYAEWSIKPRRIVRPVRAANAPGSARYRRGYPVRARRSYPSNIVVVRIDYIHIARAVHGNPLGTLPLMSLLSPLSLALLVTPAWYGVTLRAAGLLLVSQGFMYLFLRRLGVSRAVGTLAAVAYTFSGSSLIFVHRMNANICWDNFMLAKQNM